MTKPTDDLATFLDYARRSFAPAAQMNEWLVRNVERAARFQYEVAGDWMQFGLEQLQAAARLSTEAQAGFARWVEDATAGGA